MPRLTFATTQETLSTHNINLTKEGRKYIVVVQSGYSSTHNTLAEVMEYCESHIDRETEADEANYFANQKQVRLSEARQASANIAQAERNEQLFQEVHNAGLSLPNMAGTSLTEDEENLGGVLVRHSEHQKWERSMEPMTVEYEDDLGFWREPTLEELSGTRHINRGFQTFTPRVNRKLQKRANRFFASLPALA